MAGILAMFTKDTVHDSHCTSEELDYVVLSTRYTDMAIMKFVKFVDRLNATCRIQTP